VTNFIHYVQSGAYSNLFIERWEPYFVIQAGGWAVNRQNPTNQFFVTVPTFPTIINEYGVGRTYSNAFGTIAMARVSGQTNSAQSEWFFNLTNNAFLDTVDGGFTVFGQVVRGTNVLNRFNNTSTTNGLYGAQDPSQQIPFVFPVLSTTPTFNDLVYLDITLLNVQVAELTGGAKEISWQSVSNLVNRVEFTTQFPPQWQTLVSTNGTGQLIKITDSQSGNNERFYRVRVDY
jgi:cyclophilin family peptidyl-prolyl cis-trans isomerase